MRRLLIRCYPAAWRARYGDEFEVLLSERPLGPFDVADVLIGAFDARIHRRGVTNAKTGRSSLMSLRLGGWAAIAGAILWTLGFVVSSTNRTDTINVPAATLILLGSGALLVALVALSAFQARRHPVLVWAGFAVPAIGSVMAIAGLLLLGLGDGDRTLVADVTPWALWFLGTLGILFGSVIFAVTTYLTAALSRTAAAVLAIGTIVTIVGAAIASSRGEGAGVDTVALVAILVFPIGWVALGLDAIRRDSRPAIQSAA